MDKKVFRYYVQDDPLYDDFEYVIRRKRPSYKYKKYNKQFSEPSSLYGEPVYDYEPIITGRRRHNSVGEGHRRHHHHPRHYRHSERPDPPQQLYHGTHLPHIHFLSPRSEPPVRYGEPRPLQRQDIAMYRKTPSTISEPRIALYDKRRYWEHQHYYHCDCHSCPARSSKAIPSMFYDELRCPHCSAHVQPSQDEVLAYPWTVVSYRPHKTSVHDDDEIRSLATNPISVNGNLSDQGPPPPRRFDSIVNKTTNKPPTFPVTTNNNTDPKKPASIVSNNGVKAPATHVSDKLAKEVPALYNAENRTPSVSAAPTKPLFRNEQDVLTRSGEPRNGPFSRLPRAPYTSKVNYPKHDGLTTLKENADDDIRPFDSVSNVALPPMRATSMEYLTNEKRRPPRVRAATEVDVEEDTDYPREIYFRSFDRTPPYEPLTNRSRPKRDAASEISRMLKGEYYDRQTGKTYEYNVNYARRHVYSDRQSYR